MFDAKQLLQLATICGIPAEILEDQTDNEYVRCNGNGYCVYDPLKNDAQCFQLLRKLMMIDDWELFADDDVDEYYIYTWVPNEHTEKTILAAGRDMNEVIMQAAEDYLDRCTS